jgi:hypothetical protein
VSLDLVDTARREIVDSVKRFSAMPAKARLPF